MGQIIFVTEAIGTGDCFINILTKTKNFNKKENLLIPQFETTNRFSKKSKIISVEEFSFKKEQNYFLFWEQVGDTYRGVSYLALRDAFREKKDILINATVIKTVELIKNTTFDFGFKPKGVFLYKGISPLDDFKITDLISVVEKNMKSKNISSLEDKGKIKTLTLSEYKTIERNKNLFTFIDTARPFSKVIEKFSEFYTNL